MCNIPIIISNQGRNVILPYLIYSSPIFEIVCVYQETEINGMINVLSGALQLRMWALPVPKAD